MANRTTTLELKTKGLADAVAQAERLDKLLTRIEGKTASSKKRTGSGAADAALFSTENSTEAGLTRGTAAGASRGDSRDFARQAQGLGGLVHVYATFAANVFAVSAAFNALSKAADFTIMQKSADILSGQFGLALNNTAKGLRDITDGAISARQSLEMVNMGATAGINTKQMEGLTQVAKGASMALGRDLTDAMNRVFKGAIKIEPELLDELGIMVKVAESSKEYARSLNKSALELTDFEKRQAFVNAVVKQGADKYSELTGQVNPYTKLLAKISDIGMTAGAAINNVVSPVLNVLNSSTFALGGALTSIVGILTGMAIPAIRNYAQESKRANQEKLAGYAKELEAIKKQQEEFKKTGSKDTRVNKNILEATAIGTDLDKLFTSKGVETKAATKKLYKNFIESSGEAGEEAGEKLLKALNRQIKSNATNMEKLKLAGTSTKSAEANAKLLTELHNLTNNAVNSIRKEKAQLETLGKAQQAIYAKREAELATSSAKAEKLARISTITEGIGLSAGWKQLGNEMVTTTGKWEKFKLAFTGGSALIGTKIMGLVSSLGTIGMVIGIVSAGATAILGFFELLSDKADQADQAIDKLKESSKALQSSFDGLSKANTMNKLFEFSKGQAGNALESINALIKATERQQELQEKGTRLDLAIEKAKSWAGMDSQSSLGKQTSKTVSQLVQSGNLSPDFIGNLGFKDKSTQVDSTADGGAIWTKVTTAVEQFNEEIKKSPELQKRVAAAIESQVTQAEKLNNAFQNLEGSLKNIKNFSQDYVNSLMPQTNEGKLLSNFTAASANSLEILNLSSNVSGIYKQIEASADTLQNITGVTIPESLSSIVKAISKEEKNLADQVSKGTLNKEQAAKQLSDIVATNLGGDKTREFVTWTVNSTSKLQELASATSNTTIAIANISAALRKSSFFEGLTGKTESSVAERQRLDAAMISQQSKALQQEVDTLNRIKAQQLQGTPAKGREFMPVQTPEFSSLGDVQTKMKEEAKLNNMAEVIRLQSVYQGMVSTEIALGTKNAQLYALKAQIMDANVASEERLVAKNATAAEVAKLELNTMSSALKSKQSNLEVEYSLGALSEETYGTKKRSLEVDSIALKYSQDTLDILNKIATQQATMDNASANSNQKAEAAKAKGQLEKQIGNLTKDYVVDIEARIKLENQLQLKDRLKDTVSQYDLMSSAVSNINSRMDISGALTKEENINVSKLASVYTNLYANISAQMTIVDQSKLTQVEKDKQLLDLDTKRLSVIKDQVALRKIDLENSLKLIELGKASPSGWGKAAAETMSNTIEDRMKSMVSSTKVMVDGVFTAVDTSIEKLGDLMMKSNVNWKDMKESLRENFAKMLRDTMVNSMKNSFSNLMSETKKLFGLQSSADIEKQRAAELASKQVVSLDLNNTALDSATKSLDSLKSVMQQLVDKGITSGSTSSTSNSVESMGMDGLLSDTKAAKTAANNIYSGSETISSASGKYGQAANDSSIAAGKISSAGTTNLQAALKSMGASDEFTKGVGQWGNAAFGFLGDLSTMLVSSMGGGKTSQGRVFAMNLLNGAIAGFKAWAGGSASSSAGTSAIGASSGSTGTGFDLGSGMGTTSNLSSGSVMGGGDFGASYSSLGSGTYNIYPNAKGGIMTDYGPLQLQKYATGGIAHSPQLAVYGEGRKAEAYVPLPDNRSIPVTMTGGGGDTNNININVTVNSSGGTTSNTGATSTDTSKQFGQQLSKQITFVVQEELTKATRPGGLLYGR